MKLPRINDAGIGNSLVKVEISNQIKLNNVRIDKSTVQRFLDFIGVECRVTLSHRKTRRTWGTCWAKESRTILYRHSVWVFLHELAHIMNTPVEYKIVAGYYNKWRRVIPPHGKDFAECLELLYSEWIDFINIEQAKVARNINQMTKVEK